MEIAGQQLNLAEDSFRLQHLLNAGLLQHALETEEVCSAAVKEEGIEAKLQALTSLWASTNFTFTDYKTRGPIFLKVRNIWMRDY